MLRHCVLIALIALGSSARLNPVSARDVPGALGRLSAASSDERAAAERELARTLVSADAPLLAAAAHAGSAEVRARIASALMSSARHLAIAAELAASNEAVVAELGTSAIAGQAAAWLGSSDQEALPAAALQREVSGAFSGLWRLDIQRGELEDTLDEIARLVEARRIDRPGAPAPTLVLDPRFESASARPLPGAQEIVSPIVGSFETLVYTAAATHGAVLDIYGWNDGRTWVLVRPAGAASARSAQALIQDWMLAVQRPVSIQTARAAARALASTGWPAALDWLDARWREFQDPAALDALILAAGRGAVGSSLATRAGAELLLQRADRALEQAGEVRSEARQLARALLTIGSTGSEAWGPGFSRASPPGKCLRCALVSSAHSCPPQLLSQLEADLLAQDTPCEVRCAVLRALAAIGSERGADVVVPGLEAAFEWAVAHGEGRTFPLALRLLGVREPASWQEPAGVRAELLTELCADALERTGVEDGAERLAGVRLGALIARERGEELALALLEREALTSSQAQLRSGLLAARASGVNPTTIASLLVCTDLATPDEASPCVADTFARKSWGAADWRLAGAAIAQVGGALDAWPRKESKPDEHYPIFLERLELVRDQLLAAQRQSATSAKPAVVPADLAGMQAGWILGCSRVLAVLRARQCDPGTDEFMRRLRVIFQKVQHPLRRELNEHRFPPLSPAVLVDLDRMEPWVGF